MYVQYIVQRPMYRRTYPNAMMEKMMQKKKIIDSLVGVFFILVHFLRQTYNSHRLFQNKKGC